MPRRASGRVTRHSTSGSDEPSVRAAFSSAGSTLGDGRARRRTISGRPTIAEAMVAAPQVKRMRQPNHSTIGLPRPSTSSR